MKHTSLTRWSFVACAVFLSSCEREPVPIPEPLREITSIVVFERCEGQPRNEYRTVDPEAIRAVVQEFEAVRKEVAAIQAVIFGARSCHPQIGFYSQDQKVAYLIVGACTTYERAPVSGKRYFTYRRGTKDLSALRKILPVSFKEEACT